MRSLRKTLLSSPDERMPAMRQVSMMVWILGSKLAAAAGVGGAGRIVGVKGFGVAAGAVLIEEVGVKVEPSGTLVGVVVGAG